MSETENIVKHRSTIAPFECAHCGYIWYGWTSHHRATPENTTLCTPCWSALDNYIYALSKKGEVSPYEEQDIEKRHQLASTWIADKNNKPSPRPASRRYHGSVPKWLRSAIDVGLVQTNSKGVYIVYSQGDTAVNVEMADRSTLKPFK